MNRCILTKGTRLCALVSRLLSSRVVEWLLSPEIIAQVMAADRLMEGHREEASMLERFTVEGMPGNDPLMECEG